MSALPQLVVGLGNPGRQYAHTRHNVGFMVLDELAKRWGLRWRRKWRLAAMVAEATTAAGKVWLAKPQTFMNRSGTAVAALLKWLRLTPAALLVVVDDADLPLGQIRLRLAGGSGGHHGLQSVVEALGGSEQFPRLRVGIGRSRPAGQDITDHVLGTFSPAEASALAAGLAAAVAAVELALNRGLTAAMNEFNRKQPSVLRSEQKETEPK